MQKRVLWVIVDRKACRGANAPTSQISTSSADLHVKQADWLIQHHVDMFSVCILTGFGCTFQHRTAKGDCQAEHRKQKNSLKEVNFFDDKTNFNFLISSTFLFFTLWFTIRHTYYLLSTVLSTPKETYKKVFEQYLCMFAYMQPREE